MTQYFYINDSGGLSHHGILGMHWGVRRFQPYPKGHAVKGGKEVGKAKTVKQREFSKISITKTVAKNGDLGTRYVIKDKNGKIASELKSYDYNIKSFKYVLIADVKTNSSYRGKGLATKLISKMYKDVEKQNKGAYLFVKETNKTAINLYNKLEFDLIEKYKLNDEYYLIMAKGGNQNQFKGMNFS